MFAKLSRLVMAGSLVLVTLGACGSHVGEAQGVVVPDGAVQRDPDNPYWQSRPLNFDAVDPAQGRGMR
jgi:ABC-type sugar transport system substrate-binding protein